MRYVVWYRPPHKVPIPYNMCVCAACFLFVPEMFLLFFFRQVFEGCVRLERVRRRNESRKPQDATQPNLT